MERSRYPIDARLTDARRIPHRGNFQAFHPAASPAGNSNAQPNRSKADSALTSASFFADTGICAAVVALFLAPLIAIALY